MQQIVGEFEAERRRPLIRTERVAMAKLNDERIQAAFQPYLNEGETLQYWAFGVKQPNIFLIIVLVAGGTLLSLALLGGLAARAGGANVVIGAGRVTLWGALAMIATAVVGAIFGTVV